MARAARWGFPVLLLLTSSCGEPAWQMFAADIVPQEKTVIWSVRGAGGVEITFDVRGMGDRALVLVHGWSCDRSYWSGQADALADDFRIVTLDLAGHGASGKLREHWTMEEFGADVTAVVEALDLKNVVLVGHSMGADVVTEAALQLRGRVKGVVWLDQYNDLDNGLTDAQIAELLKPFEADFGKTTEAFVRGMFPPGGDPALTDRVARDMASAPPKIAIATLSATKIHGQKIAEKVARLGVPIVTINASNSPTNEESLGRHGVKAVTMPETGHFLMMDDPPRFNAVLRQVIAENF